MWLSRSRCHTVLIYQIPVAFDTISCSPLLETLDITSPPCFPPASMTTNSHSPLLVPHFPSVFLECVVLGLHFCLHLMVGSFLAIYSFEYNCIFSTSTYTCSPNFYSAFQTHPCTFTLLTQRLHWCVIDIWYLIGTWNSIFSNFNSWTFTQNPFLLPCSRISANNNSISPTSWPKLEN